MDRNIEFKIIPDLYITPLVPIVVKVVVYNEVVVILQTCLFFGKEWCPVDRYPCFIYLFGKFRVIFNLGINI